MHASAETRNLGNLESEIQAQILKVKHELQKLYPFVTFETERARRRPDEETVDLYHRLVSIGPGILKRLYADRITSADNVVLEKQLECKKCKTVLGIKTIYQKENRPAYRLFAGAIEKKIIKKDKIEL